MTNYEKITKASVKELAAFLDGQCWNDDAPWTNWFNDKYCLRCEPIEIQPEGYYHPVDCAWCELNEGCKFFDHYLTPEEVCEKWLLEETE